MSWSDASRRTPSAIGAWSLEEFALDPIGATPLPLDEAPTAPAFDEAAERARIAEEAFAQGYEEGRIAGEIAERTRLQGAVRACTDALAAVNDSSQRWLEHVEENICALAVAVARQIVGREIETADEIVRDLVRRALAEFPIDQPVTVRLNPTDLSVLQSADPALAERREAVWVADARIAQGGCMVEGRDRVIDGRVDTALERLYRRLSYTGA